MTTFSNMTSILRAIATSAAMGAAYPSWDDAFARKEVRNEWLNTSDTMRRRNPIIFSALDIKGLSPDEMDMLGFGVWSKESGLRLIPLWLFHYISDETKLTSIDGSTSMKPDCDLDVRFGCIAFGIAAD